MSTRTFAVFLDDSALPTAPAQELHNITNILGRTAVARPCKLKKAATMPLLAYDASEKENVDPRTGLATTTSLANAAPGHERPAKKRRTALATTQVKGKPVLARSRSAADIAAAGAALKPRKPVSKRAPSPAPALAPVAEFTFSSPLPSLPPSPSSSSTVAPAVVDDVQAFVDGLFADADDMLVEPTAAPTHVTCPATAITDDA